MRTSYLTVKGYGEHGIVIQKSRFIAYIQRAVTEEEAQEFIQKIKKMNWNATHNCSAYMVGENNQFQKANDDGEPSGTAGVPMLEVLKKKNLQDTVVVVTRYFGGIKLGAGGLIRAYSKATSEGIKYVGMVERKRMRKMTTVIDYPWLGKVENAFRSSIYEIQDIAYLDRVQISTYVDIGKEDTFKKWVTELTNGQGEIVDGDTLYVEIPVSDSRNFLPED